MIDTVIANIYVVFCNFIYIISFNPCKNPVILVLLLSLFFKVRKIRYRGVSKFSQDQPTGKHQN